MIPYPDQFVGIATWRGDGNPQNIKYNLKPDLIWIKGRSNARDHVLFDTNRKPLQTITTNSTAGQANQSNTLTSFNSDGFTVGDQSRTGANNETYIGWTWKAGGPIGVGRSFMIDNVGFATAGNANMGIGDLNSAAYNTSETWTTASDAGSRAFDGSKAYDSGQNRFYGSSTLHTAIDAATTFTNVTSVIVGVSENANDITIDGTAYSTTY